MEKLIFSFSLILSGLIIGYGLKQLNPDGFFRGRLSIDELRKILQKVGLLFFMPVAFLGAVWILSFSDNRIFLMPLFGLFALITGGVLGLLFAKTTKAPPGKTAILYGCSSFTNIGSIGALVCYVFLGEKGFALVAFYKVFEEIYYYTIGFPIIRYLSGAEKSDNTNFLKRLLTVLKDPFVATILSAFILGLILNLSNVARPAFFETVSSLFVPLGTFILIVSVGLGMRLSRIGKYFPTAIGVTLIKSVLVPAITVSLAVMIGMGDLDGGLQLKVIAILSSMPVAFNSLVAASIYDLELDLANSCWLVSTVSLAPVMLWLYWILIVFPA